MNCNYIPLMFFAFAFAGCSVTVEYSHVEKVSMETTAAPEARGASEYQKPSSSRFRGTASFHVGKTESEKLSGITNEAGGCRDTALCEGLDRKNIRENVDATYQVKYPYATVSLDYLIKSNYLLRGWGVTLDKGLYAYIVTGVNTRYFEVGASIGLWMHAREFEYSGTEYICRYSLFDSEFKANPFSESSGGEIAFTFGGYASVYRGPLSLSYSINVYRPSPNYGENDKVQADFIFPLVMTEYITAGYRLNKNWELRLGATNTFGDFAGWHWGMTGGLSYYFTRNPME